MAGIYTVNCFGDSYVICEYDVMEVVNEGPTENGITIVNEDGTYRTKENQNLNEKFYWLLLSGHIKYKNIITDNIKHFYPGDSNNGEVDEIGITEVCVLKKSKFLGLRKSQSSRWVDKLISVKINKDSTYLLNAGEKFLLAEGTATIGDKILEGPIQLQAKTNRILTATSDCVGIKILD